MDINYSNILDNINDGFYILDHQWNFLYLNRLARKYLERDGVSLLYKNFWEEFPQSKKNAFFRHLQNAKKTNKVTEFEIKYEQLDSWFRVKVYPVKEGYFVYFTDISEHKKSQQLLRSRLKLQAALASLSQKALTYYPLQSLFKDTATQLAEILDVEFTKILKLIPEKNKLQLQAGVGWSKNVKPGETLVSAGKRSQSGFTLLSKEPVIVRDLRTETRFVGPNLLTRHDVVSGMSVIIHQKDGPWGVLGIHTRQYRDFTVEDISYLQSVANVLSLAINLHTTMQDLLQSESNFRGLIESMPQIVWVSDTQSNAEYYNRQWYDFTAANRDESQPDGWISYVHPDDQEKTLKAWHSARKNNKKYQIEFRLQKGQTDKYYWFLVRVVPIKNYKGEVTKWIGSATNIDEQKRLLDSQIFLSEASRLLTSSLDFRKNLPKVARLAVPIIADWCQIEMIDEAGQSMELLGLAHKDIKMVKWALRLRDTYPINMDDATGVAKVLRTGETEYYPDIPDSLIEAAARDEEQLELIRKIGFSSVIIVPIRKNDQVIGAITFVSTESKRKFSSSDLQMAHELASRISLAIQNALLFEEIERHKAQFMALYNANIIGVVRGRLGFQSIDVNDAFLKMLGYSRNDLKNDRINWRKITPLEHKSRDDIAIVELLKTGSATTWEKEFIRSDGSQVPVIVGMTLVNRKEKEYIAFILDITERKRLEQRKDEFIGIASHELKTPLTSIKGYTQILERIIQEMGDERATKYLKKTNIYIDRLNSLIADLLDVSKIQAGKLQMNFETFSFDSLVSESIENMQYLSSQHQIIVQGKTKLQMHGDKHRLEQVFTNLLSNAIKYSPAANQIIVSVKKQKTKITVSVKDFGIGIPETNLSKLFDRFYRVEEVTKQFSGLGIGLYISAEIIKRHQGRIWVESTFGEGSTFIFELPLVTE